ncbi:two-component system OmpR family response regulator [Pseudonocardia eucalypti]|nr:two-component system OmpR family response regulator [Pseudonocardia eucalypti]
MRDLLRAALSYTGYPLRVAGPGEEAVTVAESWAPSVVVQDGFAVTRRQRGRSVAVPALFLTPGTELRSRLPGLTLGGGDYLTKPFSPAELIARVRAVLRRSSPAHQSEGALLRCADLELSEESHRVSRAGQPIHLSLTEFALLRFLMQNSDRILGRVQILEHVWPYDYQDSQNVVETFMSRLRAKVDRGQPAMIHNIRGVGYVLRTPDQGTDQPRG